MKRRSQSTAMPSGLQQPPLGSARTAAIIETIGDVLSLVFLGAALLYSNQRFILTDEEALTLNTAAQPIAAIVRLWHSGTAATGHFVLYTLLLHGWLRLTGSDLQWVRLPSCIFFLAGLWMLSRAARRIAGGPSGSAVLWAGVLWPYGFHFGRLVTSYSFLFFLISVLVFAYLRYCSRPDGKTWALVCALALLLIYATYAGWAFLLFLAADNWLESRRQNRSSGLQLAVSAALLALLYVPLWSSLAHQVSALVHVRSTWRLFVLNAAYNTYALLASESIAPWLWRFSLLAIIAIAVTLSLSFAGLRGQLRRFLIFWAVLMAAMNVTGVLQPRNLLLIAPWLLLPISIALVTITPPYARRALLISVVLIAVTGWYGIFFRQYYATARFSEPWPNVADQAAEAVRGGAGVIGDNPAFFVYLTNAVKPPSANTSSPFPGFLPKVIRVPHVWSPEDWLAAGEPVQPYMLWIRGTSSAQDPGQMRQVADVLDHRCGDRTVRYLVRDPAFSWKQRLFTLPVQDPWRVEIHQYTCTGESELPSATSPSPAPPATNRPAPHISRP